MALPVQLLIASQTALWVQAQQLATPWLSPQEQKRYQSFQSDGRQREFLACRYGLRQALALSGMPLEGVYLSASEGCPPAVIPSDSMRWPPSLSLTHSQDYVGCATAPFALGVDMEVLPSKRIRNINGAASLVCAPRELQMLDNALSAAQQTALFIKFWVLKEAWFKCQGTGIDFQRMTQISSCLSAAVPTNGRIVGYAWLWSAKDLQNRQLIWALATSHPLSVQDIAVKLEEGLILSEVQSCQLFEF